MELTDLPVDRGLLARFEAWTDHYERQRDRSDHPPEWCFGSAAEEAAFIAEGDELAVGFAARLGPGWLVTYAPVLPRLT